MRGISLGLGFNRQYGTAAFDPINDADMFFYDMSDASTITETSGRANSISDKLGVQGNLVGTGADRPFTGSRTQDSLNVFDFQVSEFMEVAFGATINQPFTIVSVGAFDDLANTDYLYDGLATQVGLYQDSASTTYKMAAGAGQGTTTSDTDFHVFVAVYNGASSQLYIDGVLDGTYNAGANNMDGLTIGKANFAFFYLNGAMGQIYGVTGAMDSDTVAQHSDALITKWGI